MRAVKRKSTGEVWIGRLVSLQCLAAISFLILITPRAAGAKTNWTLVWSDEFNDAAGSAPSSAIWTIKDKGSNANNELQVYCAPTDNVAPCSATAPNIFEDGNGNLVIRAIRTASGTWTSGRMSTSHTEMPQYGRIEARIKLTPGNGIWPAFWMLGSDLLTGTAWPACGEVDIMEWVPQFTPTTTSGTEHGPGYDGCCGTENAKFTFPDAGRIDDGNFHTYGVIWSENKLQYYRDDPAQIFFTLTSADIPADKQWVFNQPFFLILNLAVGGNFPKPGPDATTPNPTDMLVDYVRVYRADTSAAAGAPAAVPGTPSVPAAKP
ncbi:MAG: glycoside hydrolase family 16 protein [Candidatus Acidiferrales bacterium]